MALTTTPLFGFPRYTDDFTLTGTHWDSDYPVTNLQNLEFAKVARSTSLGAGSPDDPVIVQGTSVSLISVQGFGIAAHTLSLTATYRLQLYSDAGLTTQIYDSGLQDVWPVSYTDAELEGQIPLNPILLSQAYSIRGFKLSLFDPDNDLTYFDIGYLEIAEAWQPTVGFELGAQFGYINYTETDTLPGGLERHTVYAPSFTFSGQIPYLDETGVIAPFPNLTSPAADIHRCSLWRSSMTREIKWLWRDGLATTSCLWTCLKRIGMGSWAVQ